MLKPKKQSNLFDQFTNLYSLSKTLRFELKPITETEELLKKTNLQGKTPIQVDQEIDELYHKEMKPLFDKLHEKFINEALAKVTFENIDLEQLENKYLELKSLNKDKKNNSAEIRKLTDNITGEIPKLENRLRELIIEQFNKLGEVWKEKYNEVNLDDTGYKILTNSKILDVLLLLYPEKSESIKKFQRFFTYFNGFNQNRENYYTAKDNATGVANRIVNENLVIFIKNRSDFERFLEKVPVLADYKKYFQLENFNDCLTQEGIENYNDRVGEVKSKVNLEYNQKVEDKKQQLKGLIKLQKQIGCRTKQQREQEASGKSIYPEYLEKVGLGFQITKNNQGEYYIWEALGRITEELKPKLKKLKENYQTFFSNWQEYKLDEIWFRRESINTISSRWFGGDNWAILTKALDYSGTGKIEKGEYRIPVFVSLLELKEALNVLETGVDFDIKKSKNKNRNKTEINNEKKMFFYSSENLFKDNYKQYYKNNLFETFLSVWKYEVDYKFMQIFDGYTNENRKSTPAFLKEFEKQNKEPFDKNKKDIEKSIHVEIVKNLIEEGYLRLFQLTKYHSLEKKGEVDARPVENKFYDVLNEFWHENQIVTYHKAFQATLTKKPYSEDKIKLNFECGTLLGGWSSDYESYGTLIFYRDNKYYLGIIKGTKFSNSEVKTLYENIDVKNHAKRLLYITQKVDNKNPPRWFIRSKGTSYSPMVREGILNPKDILDIYDNKLYSKTENKNTYREYLPKLLDYYKEGFGKHKDFKKFKFDWFDSKEYETVADFYNHTADMCYKIDWEDINFDMLINLVQQNRIYLFQIYNKDFELNEAIGKIKYGDAFKADKTTGALNSHTQIFLELLKPENVKSLKLLGGGEVFFRNPSNDKKYKKDNNGRKILDAKRYYEQKYFLHFSIQIKGKERNLKNVFVNQTLIDNKENIKIIGIDRGEKHLLYYSVLGSHGKMIDSGSLNTINNIDYNAKLQTKQDKRNQARLDWEQIGNIKNFKEGYLSQAVNKIYELIIKHDAIVVMENLNSEFKAKRSAKVEKSVYKKFELALARKLNHLILKNKKPNELGGVLNAYQLTPYIEAGKIGDFERANQWGILFYVRANYTSTTDPLTGWRKHKYISNSETDKKIQEFFNPNTGVQIDYDKVKKCFKLSYRDEGKTWELFAFDDLQRFYWDNKNREIKTYDLYKEFEELFVDLDKSKNINQQIYGKNFRWRNLVFLWNLLNQIRNTDKSKKGNENDFLQSPVYSNKYQQFFDSRKVTSQEIPDNGDANGAYNIARKGAIILNRIKNCKNISNFGKDNNGKNPENSYYISDADWDKYISRSY